MKKAVLTRELRRVRRELEWLVRCEKAHNSDWRFTSTPYSKRRARLIKSYWALKAMQAR